MEDSPTATAIPPLGHHWLMDFHGCAAAGLNDPAAIEALLRQAAAAAGATVLSVSSHAFSPHGLTAVALLAESHLAIHTWPEHRFAAADLFTCGPTCEPRNALAVLRYGLGAESVEVSEAARGRYHLLKGN
ncbi:MAG: adenosylmethionine decarboxylase [Sumerlaeia bacterium]